MTASSFPDKIKSLEPFSDRFDAFRLAARGCDVLFATYPAGTTIEPHTHETDNWGVITRGKMEIEMTGVTHVFEPGHWYHIPAGKNHAARCQEFTEEIEFWFVSHSSHQQ